MNTNRRGWVKNAIIIFLAIMLILTFFSNTIMNASLPEVAAQYARSGSITSRIRTNATAIANSKHKITIDESRTVLSVAVREGDEVAVGDPLFYLVDAESNELKAAREQLESLEKQYTLKLLSASPDYYSDQLSITKKSEELSKARELLTKIGSNAALIDALELEVKQLNSEKKALDKQIQAYNTQISKLQSQAAEVSLDGKSTDERLTAAKVEYDTALAAYQSAEALRDSTAAALESAEVAYDKALEAFEALGSSGSATVDSLTEQLNQLNKTIRRYKEDYELSIKAIDDKIDAAYDAYVDADWGYNSALALYNQGKGDYDAVLRWEEKANAAKSEYESVLASQEPQKASAKLRYERDMEDYSEELAKLESLLAEAGGTEQVKTKLDRAESAKKSAQKAASDAAEDFNKKQSECTEAKSLYDSLEKLKQLEECEAQLEALTATSERITEQINDKNEELGELEAVGDDTEAQEERIKSLEQELASLRHSYEKRLEEDSLQAQRDKLELDELIEQIEEQKALVAKHEANSVDAKITAEIAGQVNSISVVAGSETSIGQTLCEIVVTELGYSCEVSLTAEQAKRVRVGDEVTVSNNWWSEIKASIASLRNDPKNPGSTKIAVISLVGDVAEGQSLSLTIGEKGQTYDAVVPNSAVREDNNGKFVLAVEAKSSPLGNRYIAKRVDVNVLASDDTNSAVNGLMGSEFVITTSNTPIAAGQQVRMSES